MNILWFTARKNAIDIGFLVTNERVLLYGGIFELKLDIYDGVFLMVFSVGIPYFIEVGVVVHSHDINLQDDDVFNDYV